MSIVMRLEGQRFGFMAFALLTLAAAACGGREAGPPDAVQTTATHLTASTRPEPADASAGPPPETATVGNPLTLDAVTAVLPPSESAKFTDQVQNGVVSSRAEASSARREASSKRRVKLTEQEPQRLAALPKVTPRRFSAVEFASIATEGGDADPPSREGYAVPLMYSLRESDAVLCAEARRRFAANDRTGTPIHGAPCGCRVNLLLVTRSLPAEAWHAMQATLADGDEDWTGEAFAVRLWVLRNGSERAQVVRTLRVPNEPSRIAQFQLSADEFERGDLAIIENSPGLFPDALRASIIDNVSNDPTPFPLVKVPFR